LLIWLKNNSYFCDIIVPVKNLFDNIMIQRIQTVFIFIAALFTASLLKLKFAELAVNDELYSFLAKGIVKGDEVIYEGLPLMLFTGLVTLLHLVAIFMYKKRIRQMRLLGFIILLLLGLSGLMFFFIYSAFDDVKVAFRIPMTFPLISIILDYLAIRAVGKDEALVRSIDRIR
jgi:hypothetical protein